MKTKLTKKETTEILCWCATLNDDELKKEYYRLSYELGAIHIFEV